MNTEILASHFAEQAKDNYDNMLNFLKSIVTLESGSRDTEDVNQLGDYLIDTCRTMGAEITRIASPAGTGDPFACTFNCAADSDTKRILMVCHRDTVFPHGTIQERPFTEDETQVYGPGVADQKGGITIGIHALKILQEMKNAVGAIPLEIVFSSDEEIGSPGSSAFIAERAKNAKVAFFMEPARALSNGKLVLGRDGGDLIDLEVFGHSAHAGNAFAEGISAINALAAVITDFAKLSDDAAGYSTNVGIMGGGVGPIIVADHAWAKVFTRFSTLEQREYLLKSFKEIVDKHNAEGQARIEMRDPVGFLPFIPNKKNQSLFELVQKAGAHFDLVLEGFCVRGAADAGITSCAGVPTICGMGIVGDHLHTEREFAVKASLVERLQVVLMAIVLANQAFE